MPRRPTHRLVLLLLPQSPPPQPRPLPRQGPLPVRPDGPSPVPPAPRHRGSRVRPASHLLRHQRARHRLYRHQVRQLALLRPPARLRQRPRAAHRPPPHPARPRRLQGALGHHPRRQPRHRPARPNLRGRRPRRTRRRSARAPRRAAVRAARATAHGRMGSRASPLPVSRSERSNTSASCSASVPARPQAPFRPPRICSRTRATLQSTKPAARIHPQPPTRKNK